jgi:hypothetical protein
LPERRFCAVRVNDIFRKPTDDWLSEGKGWSASTQSEKSGQTLYTTSEVVLFRATILKNVAHNFVAFAYDSRLLRFTFGICLEQMHKAYRFSEIRPYGP